MKTIIIKIISHFKKFITTNKFLKNWKKLIFLGFFIYLGIWLLIFIIKTGEFPSIYTNKRYSQIAKFYFSRNADLIIKEGYLSNTGIKSLVAFQKDEYFESVFSNNLPDSPFEKPFENKVVILDFVDLGFLNPVLSYLYPIKKSYEIKPTRDKELNDPRIYDIELIDLDNDQRQEIVIHWLYYCGGSGGTLFSSVITENNGEYFFSDCIPNFELISKEKVKQLKIALEQQKATNNIEELDVYFILQDLKIEEMEKILSEQNPPIKEGEFLKGTTPHYMNFKINNVELKKEIFLTHTDEFKKFCNIDSDENIELVVAYPDGDGITHYSPQSWNIVVYEFQGKKFVEDPEFKILTIPKSAKYGLKEMHGYTYVNPFFGNIFFMWRPSWLSIESRHDASLKTRTESPVITYLKKKGYLK